MAVARVVDAGNVAQSDRGPEDNFIMNVGSNDKVCLRWKGYSFVLKTELAEVHFKRRCVVLRDWAVRPLIWNLWEMRMRRETGRMEVRLTGSQMSIWRR